MRQIYPITTVENVIDDSTNKNIKEIINQHNHINIGYQTTIDAARLSVPRDIRKQGLYITYNVNNVIYTDIFIGTKYNIDDDEFVKSIYWKNINAIIV